MAERALPPIVEDGFRGMHASSRATVPAGHLSYALNLFLQDRTWRPRPGLVQAGTTLSTGNPVQACGFFREVDTTPHVFAICDQKLFRYDFGTDSWASIDLVSKGVTVSGTARIDWTVSRGRIVFVDTVNDPWMWDPSPGGDGTFTVLTLAQLGAGAGKPGGATLYYDKIMVWDPESSVFAWSDEGDPGNGYDGSNQSWDFSQSDAGPIIAMVGMNSVMPIFKSDSIAKLQGEADENFQTDAVREGVSDTEGAAAQFGVRLADGDAYFLARTGFRALASGTRQVRIDEDPAGDSMLGDRFADYTGSGLANTISFFDRGRRHIVWLMPKSGETTVYSGFLYALDENAWSAVDFSGMSPDFVSAGTVEGEDGEDLVFLGTATGDVFIYGSDGVYADDGQSITYTAESVRYGRAVPSAQKRLVQTDFLLNVVSDEFIGKVSPIVDGVPMTARGKSFYYEDPGRRRKRKQFNAMGYDVGWQITCSTVGHAFELEAAITTLSSSGNHPSRG